MPFKIGALELVIVLVIVMVIFGAGKLPQVGSSIGKAIREFRRAQEREPGSEIAQATSGDQKREGG